MSALHTLVEQAYEQAKTGNLDNLLSEWRELPILARRCSRYQKEGSGWTFLHQAAYFGHEIACRELISLGADIGAISSTGMTPIQVSTDKDHPALAALLQRALQDRNSLWAPSSDPDLRPSSNAWDEAVKRYSSEAFLVAYAGGVVKVLVGSTFYVDSLNRILIGWHGTFDPPRDMAGEPLLPRTFS